MKKFIFIILAIALLCTSSAGAFDATAGFGVGALMQGGEKTTTMYHFEMNAPIVTRDSAGYIISMEGSTIFSDRGIAGISEIEGQRIMTVGTKRLGRGISAVLGTGLWKLTNSSGDNKEYSAATFGFIGKILGFEVSLRSDMVLIPSAKDLWYPNCTIRLLGI